MEDPIVQKLKELTWTEKQIREAHPQVLLELVKTYKDWIKFAIRQKRLVLANPEWHDFQQEIGIEWGKWSREFNKVLRAIIKEHELFDTDLMRLKTKMYNIVYLYWWACAQYIELINTDLLGFQIKKLATAVGKMNHIEEHMVILVKEEKEIES
ncbi:MAG: hypothetical protein PF503_18770 [Desulfobacula sp.]|jgi:hypothetical protein|nr:hypothetical protein [Desulfobacula sp.]